MFKSKEFHGSIMPVVVANSILCTGLLEYFADRSTRIIGFFYAIFILVSYCTFFYTFRDLVQETWEKQLTNTTTIMVYYQFVWNTIIYVLAIFAGIMRSKQMRLSVRQLENCARAMDELGILGSYSPLIIHEYLVGLICFIVITCMVITDLVWYRNYDGNYGTIICFGIVDSVPPFVAFIVDSSFIFWIRYTKIKLGQLNVVLRSMLTTTIESPQHRRVLRARDKWKNNSPSSIIYQNYNASINVRKIKRVKQIHLELIKIARNMNEAYGSHILVSITMCFVGIIMLLYNLYDALFSSKNHLSPLDFGVYSFWIFYLGSKVLGISHICATTAMEVFVIFAHVTNTADILYELYEPSASKELRGEVRDFMEQLLQNPLTFSAYGFFDLDHTLISGIIGSVTTYLVILIQVGHGPKKGVTNITENSTSTI